MWAFYGCRCLFFPVLIPRVTLRTYREDDRPASERKLAGRFVSCRSGGWVRREGALDHRNTKPRNARHADVDGGAVNPAPGAGKTC